MAVPPSIKENEACSPDQPGEARGDRHGRLYSRETLQAQPSAIREICSLVARPEVRSLAGGWPDPAVFPKKKVAALLAGLMEEKGDQLLQYGSTEGVTELRALLAQRMTDEGLAGVGPDNILITHGSAQGMQLAAQVFINPGDLALVGLPTYFGGPGAVLARGGRPVGVPVDGEGMDTRALEEELEQRRKAGERAKAVYVIPDFQNPTGTTLSLKRREHLMALAREHDLIVIEDTPYRDLIYEGQNLPSLKALDQEERVVQLRSVSKILAPGLRLGWAVAEAGAIRRMAVAKQFVDAATNTPAQYLFLEYLKRGYLEEGIARNIEHYRAKRDFMLNCLERYFPGEVSWSRPRGGFFIFVRLPQGQDAAELFARAVEANVAFVIGRPFFVDGSGAETFRLSFSQAGREDIEAALKILGRLLG